MREAEGRDAEPSACVLDAQSVKTSANAPTAGQGPVDVRVDFVALPVAEVEAVAVGPHRDPIRPMANLKRLVPKLRPGPRTISRRGMSDNDARLFRQDPMDVTPGLQHQIQRLLTVVADHQPCRSPREHFRHPFLALRARA